MKCTEYENCAQVSYFVHFQRVHQKNSTNVYNLYVLRSFLNLSVAHVKSIDLAHLDLWITGKYMTGLINSLTMLLISQIRTLIINYMYSPSLTRGRIQDSVLGGGAIFEI